MWAHILGTALGIWLMAAPDLLGYRGPARTSDHIVGPLVATFACMAIWEVTRPARWINLALGIWLVVAAGVFWSGWLLAAHGAAVGALVAALALVRGEMKLRIGGGWPALWRRDGGGSSPT